MWKFTYVVHLKLSNIVREPYLNKEKRDLESLLQLLL